MAAEEFCTFEEKGKRCVGALRHNEGKHVMQGKNSATVRAIERQTWPEKKVEEKVVSKSKDS